MLAMTIQLIEADLPVILVVNIMDEAERMGLSIDLELLRQHPHPPLLEQAEGFVLPLELPAGIVHLGDQEVHRILDLLPAGLDRLLDEEGGQPVRHLLGLERATVHELDREAVPARVGVLVDGDAARHAEVQAENRPLTGGRQPHRLAAPESLGERAADEGVGGALGAIAVAAHHEIVLAIVVRV